MEECKDLICKYYRWTFCKDLYEIKGWESVWFVINWIAILTALTSTFRWLFDNGL